jgi:hypothetical protein
VPLLRHGPHGGPDWYPWGRATSWRRRLAVAIIGQAQALARGLVTKQVDRLLGNDGIDLRDEFTRWVPHRARGHRTPGPHT